MQRISMLKLGFNPSLTLENRIFNSPRVKRDLGILCLKGKEYCSSVPVRYIPKKSRKTNEKVIQPIGESSEKDEFPSSLDLGTTGSLVKDSWRSARRSVFLDVKKRNQIGMYNNSFLDVKGQELKDENYGFRNQEAKIEPKEVFEEVKLRMEEDTSKKSVGRADTSAEDAENIAIEILAKRAVTVAELRKKLSGRKFPLYIVEGVIHDFRSRGLINDVLYAESFSRSRWSSSSWGPQRIKQALYRKGVSASDAETAIKLVFEGGDHDAEESSGLGLSRPAFDHLFVQASKQWARGQDKPKETRKARVIRWLQYRGFNWGVISLVLNKLESTCP